MAAFATHSRLAALFNMPLPGVCPVSVLCPEATCFRGGVTGGKNFQNKLLTMLHAIAEVDSNEDNSQKQSAPDLLSSDGSLSGEKYLY
jgi:hypothetical protein